MGILSTAAIIAVIAILIVGAAFVAFHKVITPKLTVQQAEGLVVKDIKAQNPNANVSLISAVNSTLAVNSWLITLSVVYNGTRPCPTVLIEQFDYPATGLQSTTSTTYSYLNSNGCHVPTQQSQSLPITLPIKSSIAIATAYASGNNAITSYVGISGYNNTFVTATFQGGMNSTILGNMTNVWLVTYQGTNSANSLYAILSQSGTIMQTYNASG